MSVHQCVGYINTRLEPLEIESCNFISGISVQIKRTFFSFVKKCMQVASARAMVYMQKQQ